MTTQKTIETISNLSWTLSPTQTIKPFSQHHPNQPSETTKSQHLENKRQPPQSGPGLILQASSLSVQKPHKFPSQTVK
ncbi:hypothetical protein CEXT_132031 [Caerostris extrusa]|uniref:Uncharacterized protein n=1 Tax=Caerostris extrusa TaxID=172846 RepID=A0AAV4Y5J7_CAEEX|nr:hypothetical protein CEXT_132031 [Caerostris extrusa]